MLYALSMTCPFEESAEADLRTPLYPETLARLRTRFEAESTATLRLPTTSDEEA